MEKGIQSVILYVRHKRDYKPDVINKIARVALGFLEEFVVL